MRKMFTVCFLFLFAALTAAETPEIQKTIDRKATAASVFELVLITLVPAGAGVIAARRSEVRSEMTGAAIMLSIPALISWPLFIRDMRRAKKLPVQ